MKIKIKLKSGNPSKITELLKRFGSDPMSDWKVMVVGGSILALIVVCASGYLFYEIYRGGIFSVETKERATVERLDKSRLESTISSFEQKRMNLEALKLRGNSYADPFQF